MSRTEFALALREAAAGVDEEPMAEELAPLLDATELAGLEARLRSAVVRLAEGLEEG